MIVILCDTWQEAIDGFDIFMQFLEEQIPWSIKRVWEACYCVETDDDLKYLFTHYKMSNVFDTLDLVNYDKFVEGLDNWVYENHYL